MQLHEFLNESLIISQFEADSKQHALSQLVDHLASQLPEVVAQDILTLVEEREALSTTGIGFGIAVPHCKTAHVEELTIVFARSTGGFEFQALDGEPVHLLFLLVAPENSTSEHIKALAKIARFAKDQKMREGLTQCATSAELLSFITEQESQFS